MSRRGAWLLIPFAVFAVFVALAGRRWAVADGGSAALIVNECASGPSGWIELLNHGSEPVDLTSDPGLCWFVDDAVCGGSPKLVTETGVNHASGSKTCSALGRPATCGAVGPGEAVWVRYAF